MVSLTRRAAEKIRQNRSENKYIRLKAERTLEDAVSYEIDFTDKVNNDDILYMSYGIKILVGSSTRKYFEDLKVDYAGANGNGAYTFDTTEVLSAEF